MSARLNGTAEAVRQSGPTNAPQDLIDAAIALDLTATIQAAAPACWNTGMLLLRSASPASQALGYSLAVDALNRTPGAMALVHDYLAANSGETVELYADRMGDAQWQRAGRLLPTGVARYAACSR